MRESNTTDASWKSAKTETLAWGETKNTSNNFASEGGSNNSSWGECKNGFTGNNNGGWDQNNNFSFSNDTSNEGGASWVRNDKVASWGDAESSSKFENNGNTS